MKALLFDGQGKLSNTQIIELTKEFHLIKSVFDLASQVVNKDILSSENINDASLSQLKVFTLEYALYQAMNLNQESQVLLGLSLGEISALTCAGALEFVDAVKLVVKRTKLMQKVAQKRAMGMVAVFGFSIAAAKQLCAAEKALGEAYLANINAKDQIVIGGDKDVIQKIHEKIRRTDGKKSFLLPLEVASHTPLMEPVLNEWQKLLINTKFRGPVHPVISSTVLVPFNIVTVRDVLAEQLVTTTRFADAVGVLKSFKIDEFFELGYSTTLIKSVKQIRPDAKLTAIRNASDLKEYLQRGA